MVALSVTIQNGTEVVRRLSDLANAARVFAGDKAQVSSDDPVAKFVEEGTRPHDIYPRNKKALFWPGASHPITHVHHPGTRPNPFLERALSSTRGTVDGYVADQLEMVAAGQGSNYSQIMPGAAKIVLAAAQQEAPVKTGKLRASLYIV